jgi:hypothetical protein
MSQEAGPRPGRLRRALHRLSADADQLDAEELQEDIATEGATPVARCGNREVVCVYGVLKTVTLKPRGGAPTLEAQLYDGSGSVYLVWLGRRRIAGVQPGRQIVARGRITVHEGRPVIFNPDYELKAS